MWPDPSRLDLSLDSRSVTFENPTGARGRGRRDARRPQGRAVAADPRRASRSCSPTSRARARSATSGAPCPPAPPEALRALVLEVFYDDHDEPSISVPLLDFFGAPLGRPVAYASAADASSPKAAASTRTSRCRSATACASSSRTIRARYVELLLPDRLHARAGAPRRRGAAARVVPAREPDDAAAATSSSPTACAGRAASSVAWSACGRSTAGMWYGEGEVKVFRDGDRELPTICGTGLEDYVGSAWGMGPHAGPYAGAPLDVRAARRVAARDPRLRRLLPLAPPRPDRVRATTCGSRSSRSARSASRPADEAEADAYFATNPPAGRGIAARRASRRRGVRRSASGSTTTRPPRSCTPGTPQPVPRVDVAAACADIERRSYETPDVMESFFGS